MHTCAIIFHTHTLLFFYEIALVHHLQNQEGVVDVLRSALHNELIFHTQPMHCELLIRHKHSLESHIR